MRKSYILIIITNILFFSCNKIGLKNRDGWLIGNNIDSFIQGETSSSLNLIWVIDNSLSMEGDQQSLAENFEFFIDAFVDTDISYKMGITTTDMTSKGARGEFIIASRGEPESRILTSQHTRSYVIENFKKNISVGTGGSGREKGLSAALAAIEASKNSSSYNHNFIVSKSHVAIVIVSDEDEDSNSNTSADELNEIIDKLRTFKASHGQRLSIYPIINSTSVLKCKNNTQERQGKNYIKAVNILGGIVFDKCDDFGDSLLFLGEEMVNTLKRFILSKIPIPDTIAVFVNDKEVKSGWSFDEKNNSIEFSDIPNAGDRVDVKYETNLGKIE